MMCAILLIIGIVFNHLMLYLFFRKEAYKIEDYGDLIVIVACTTMPFFMGAMFSVFKITDWMLDLIEKPIRKRRKK